MAYNPQNIDKKEISIVNALKIKVVSDIEGALTDIEYLKSALEQFKTASIESLDNTIELKDILLKYTKSETFNAGSYNLPGVFSDVYSYYNTNEAKQDSERAGEIKQSKEKNDQARDLVYKMVLQNYNDLQKRLKSLAVTNQQLFNYLESDSIMNK
jgi:hypothetical protein